MKLGFFSGLAIALACILSSGPSVAQDASALPSVTTLKCGKDCGSATDPLPLGEHRVAGFPGFNPENYPTEGFVVVRATITKEGNLRDLKVVQVIGPQIFADNALKSIMDWRYQPATRAGVPVDRPNWEIRVFFTYGNGITGARQEVYRIFQQAMSLSRDGKHAETIALLLPVLSKPHLSFYEREVVSLQLAIEYANQGELLTAREYLDEIVLLGDSFLSAHLRPIFWRAATLVNARTGQLIEAKEAFDKLNAAEPVASGDPLAKLMQTAEEQARTAKYLSSMQRISTTGVLPTWTHRLLRHNFSIVNVTGKLDHLTIGCGEHLLESTFAEKAEWHIPKDWEKCRLRVFGDAGTTFTLVETDE
jgi:TonB family protein